MNLNTSNRNVSIRINTSKMTQIAAMCAAAVGTTNATAPMSPTKNPFSSNSRDISTFNQHRRRGRDGLGSDKLTPADRESQLFPLGRDNNNKNNIVEKTDDIELEDGQHALKQLQRAAVSAQKRERQEVADIHEAEDTTQTEARRLKKHNAVQMPRRKIAKMVRARIQNVVQGKK